jgi:hypothetical protein
MAGVDAAWLVVVCVLSAVVLVLAGLLLRRREKLSPRVPFGDLAGQALSTLRTAELPPDLGTALRTAAQSDVCVVDLGRGQSWQETELFILVAGTARQVRPQAIVFVADQAGQERRFLGWADPRRLLPLHLEAGPRDEYARALAEFRRWQLGTPAGEGPEGQPAVILPWGGRAYLPAGGDPRFALELLLETILHDVGPVGVSRLQELYAAELVTAKIDAAAGDQAWREALAEPQRFVGLTESGRFRGLVPWEGLIVRLLA